MCWRSIGSEVVNQTTVGEIMDLRCQGPFQCKAELLSQVSAIWTVYKNVLLTLNFVLFLRAVHGTGRLFKGTLGRPKPIRSASKLYLKWQPYYSDSSLAHVGLKCSSWMKLLQLGLIWWSAQHVGNFQQIVSLWRSSNLDCWDRHVHTLITQPLPPQKKENGHKTYLGWEL